MDQIITGQLKSSNAQASLDDCRVEMAFQQVLGKLARSRVVNAETNSAVDIRNSRLTTRTDGNGEFTIRLPANSRVSKNQLEFSVFSPAGKLIGKKVMSLDAALDKVVIEVKSDDLAPIGLATLSVSIPVSRRIHGRVVDRAGKQVPAGLQVILRVNPGNTQASNSLPVLVARTDMSGSFFGTVPNQSYKSADLLVAGVGTPFEIQLESDKIPHELIVIIDLSDNMLSAQDCACKDAATPRTPSHNDIENAPEAYSVDLGTGKCINFNTPNRSIEEFDYFTVVRTTEPDIVGFTAEGSAGTQAPPTTDATLSALEIARQAALEEAAAASAMATQAAQASAAAKADAQAAQPVLDALNNEPARSMVWNAIWDELSSRLGESEEMARTNVEAALMPLGAVVARRIAEIVAKPIAGVTEQRLKQTHPREGVATQLLQDATTYALSLARVSGSRAADAEAAAAAARKRAADAATAAASASAAVDAKRRELAEQEAQQASRDRNKAGGRARLNAKNPIDWDETPSFYQAAEIAHGHLLHYKQVWYADGYSLGDLLYSVPLAPGQKRLISILDWERKEQAEQQENTSFSEGLTASLSRDRDLSEVIKGALSESSRGGSRSTSAGVGVGTGAAGNGSYQGFNFGALLGVSGGYGESNSSAWQDSARNLASSSLQNLRDRTLQSASAIRSLRSTVVRAVSQGEAVRATTEVIANHNHCHAMTVQYFEVLRHLKLVQELASVQECLFVPLPMGNFDMAKALRWSQELSTYLKLPALAKGFDAARRVQTNWTQVDMPIGRYAEEFVTALSGEFLVTVIVPPPPFPERPKPNPEDTAADTAKAMAESLNPTTGVLGILLAVATGGASLVAGAATSAAIEATRAAGKGARALAEDYYAENDPQQRYARFHQEIVPGVVEAFINQLNLYLKVSGRDPIHISSADFTLVSEYRAGTPLAVAVRAPLPGQYRRADISQVMIRSSTGLPASFRAILNTANIRYRTASFEHQMVDDRRVNDDIEPPLAIPVFNGPFEFSIEYRDSGKGVTIFTPLDEWEQRNPRKDDQRLAGELVEHLNDNFEYYHHAIWWAMDPNRRYMLLDGYYAPGSSQRSVASVVENRVIGIVGNSIVLPVAPGVHLDPRFAPDAEGNQVDLLDFYKPDMPFPATRISLPTRGVFAEAVMGNCNSCEEIDDSRFWRWEESPIDEPTTIEPLSTATRRAEPGSLQPSTMPSPIVSIQNAPSVPDPAGIAAVLGALGKESFTDITGLAGTQQNAAAAYQQALDTAYKFGKEASTLAQQAAMLNAKDKVFGDIDKAEESGKIDSEDAKKYRRNTFDKLTLSEPPMVEAVPSQPEEWETWPGATESTDPTPVPTPTPVPGKPKPKPAKPKPSKVIPVTIKLRVFVPSEIWEPYPSILSITKPQALIRYNGDHREFDPKIGSSRVQMEYSLRINVDTLEVMETPVQKPSYGEAEVYWQGDTVDVQGKPEWWEAKADSSVQPRISKRMSHDESKFHVDLEELGDRIVVTFVLAAQPYLPWGKDDLPLEGIDVEFGGISARAIIANLLDGNAPDIDAKIKLTITKRGDGMLQYNVSGWHDLFPAYELYVNDENAYRFGEGADITAKDAPEKLLEKKTIAVDEARVIKTTP